MVRSIPDIYHLEPSELASLDRMGETSAAKLCAAIEGSKSRGAARLIYALGIRGVGEVAARALAEEFGGVRQLAKAGAERLTEIADIGAVTAESIAEFFSRPPPQPSLSTDSTNAELCSNQRARSAAVMRSTG